jgi:hypothetical protein
MKEIKRRKLSKADIKFIKSEKRFGIVLAAAILAFGGFF